MLKINISIDKPEEKQPALPSLKEKVEAYLLAVESNQIDSQHEFDYLICLYKKLAKLKKLSPELKALYGQIKEMAVKHGKYQNDNSILDTSEFYGVEDYE